MSASSLQIFISPATAAAPPGATIAMCAAMLAGDWPRNYILFTLDSAAAQKQAAYGGKMADNSTQCRGFIFLYLFSLFAIAPSLCSKKSTQRTHTTRAQRSSALRYPAGLKGIKQLHTSYFLSISFHHWHLYSHSWKSQHNLCSKHF